MGGVARLTGQTFWLTLAVIATGILHMAVVKKDLLAALKVPLDGGRTLRGKRLFGDNKTWRGALFMVFASALFGALQGLAFGGWAERSGAASLDFAAAGGFAPWPAAARPLGYALVAGVLGLGYALGELPNSFVKRQLDITPGKTASGAAGAFFLVVDQADSVVAALALGALCFPLGWRLVAFGTVLLTLVHLALNALLYLLRVRKNL